MWGLRSLARGRSHTLCSGSTESGPPGMPLRSHAESARARSAFPPAPEFLGQLCCPCRRPATATLQARISPNLLVFFVVVFPQFPQDSLLISPPSCFPLPPMPLISQRSPHTSAYPWGHPGVGCGCRHRAERGGRGQGRLGLRKERLRGRLTWSQLRVFTQISYYCWLVAQSYPTLATPWTVALQAPLSWDFPDKNTGVGCHALLQGISPPRNRTCVPSVSCIGR